LRVVNFGLLKSKCSISSVWLQSDSKRKARRRHVKRKAELHKKGAVLVRASRRTYLWKAAAQKLHAEVGTRRALKGPHVGALGRRDLKQKE
jgi:hypothetical protein